MTTSPTYSVFERFNPIQWAGPVFGRELRISSRRPTSYIIRTGYIALMCLFALGTWCSFMGALRFNPSLFGASRASEVAQRLTQSILWFQFLGAQLLAAAMLSSSIVDEMHRGGLDVLLTTPIGSLQLVVGKLLSRLWQIVMLLAISLPALAVIRVMGGVPWAWVISNVCITLTAAAFIGSLCLWLSGRCRYPHQVISTAAVIYLLVFVALPGVLVPMASWLKLNQTVVAQIVNLLNPRLALLRSVSANLPGLRGGGGWFLSWPAHCVTMLELSVVLLGLCARGVRRSPFGRTVAGPHRRRGLLFGLNPVFWLELNRNVLCGRNGSLLFVAGAVFVMIGTLASKMVSPRRPFGFYETDAAWALWMIALVHLAVLATNAIAREKEGRTWSLLMTTPLDDGQILWGKLRAVFKRSLVWVLAALAVQVCYVLCSITPRNRLIVPFYALLLLASVFFVAASGLYFGLRLRTPTAALVATLGIYLFLRYVVAGSHNPIYVWLQYKILAGSRGGMKTFILFSCGTWAAVAILQVGLGAIMLWRTRVGLRHGV